MDQVGKKADTAWQRLLIRHNERGVLEDNFTARRVWTWRQGPDEAREEWLIILVERNGDHSYTLSNAPTDMPLEGLAEGACGRYFVERVIQDAKDETGWDEFQAQKYLGWEHHTARPEPDHAARDAAQEHVRSVEQFLECRISHRGGGSADRSAAGSEGGGCHLFTKP